MSVHATYRWWFLIPVYVAMVVLELFFFFFFNDPATTEIYTLSLHDALPISRLPTSPSERGSATPACAWVRCSAIDRKSTRLNSSHANISYAVFCLKKKKRKVKKKRTVSVSTP